MIVATATSRWRGAVEGLHGKYLYGWCVDTANPSARVVLEICLDGQEIGCVIADVVRSELRERLRGDPVVGSLADCCHGFVADTGLKDGRFEGVLTARVANTPCILDGHVCTARSEPPVAAASYVFGDGGLRVLGWAIDSGHEEEPVTVRAYDEQGELATAVADSDHPSLRAHAVGRHGFVLDLPPRLADGKMHQVRVVNGKGVPLNGSPITVCCYLHGAKALLPGGAGGALTDVVEMYERYLPRSMGLGFYREWARAFDEPPRHCGRERVALIVANGKADGADVETTRDSLRSQAGVEPIVLSNDTEAGRGRGFVGLVRQAVNSGSLAIACVRPGDTLEPHALAHCVDAFADPAVQVVYTDSECEGRPWFKPAWNLEYAASSDFPLDFMVVRSGLVSRLLAAQAAPRTPAAFAWGLLAMAHGMGEQTIRHVPRVLHRFNTPLADAEKALRLDAARQALATIDPRVDLTPCDGAGDDRRFQPRRLSRPLTPAEKKLRVSLVIPTRDRHELLERCIASLRQHTRWPNLEIIVVDNDSVQAPTKALLRSLARQGVKLVRHPGAFNFSEMNNRAVAAARGDIVGLINNDIEALHQGWLDEIVGQLLRPGVGAVGAKLLWPNRMVQHGGVLLGVGNVAGHFGNRLSDDDAGDHGRNLLVQQVSAVTAACLFLRKTDYVAVGGMDAKLFPVTFNDVDLCLKLRAAGKAIVWTPYARLLHVESASRGPEELPQQKSRAQREIAHLRERWGDALLRDPYYHPSLNLDAHSHPFGGLAMPPRDRAPRHNGVRP